MKVLSGNSAFPSLVILDVAGAIRDRVGKRDLWAEADNACFNCRLEGDCEAEAAEGKELVCCAWMSLRLDFEVGACLGGVGADDGSAALEGLGEEPE